MKTSVIVQNLKCGGCANTISNKLSEIENISDIHVDIEESKISFKYIDEEDAFLVKAKLKNIGYPSVEEENSMISKTKSFISCATGKF
ncbi:heavy metal-associated domain-containing protein [Xanthomarina sp. F1114]|uniref:heavy-metal-associated domain-containing protein n=1 Tax=Xanthomarina sp. F1114 TaxID=2996019 RepID=UPI00225E4397|nr:heavy metal-associated domain-containing protein [Xanthomarina sp. F1114]MCX7548592.1 heavy metal-associated domain-containing protein [Xanthomarina sp. F1114]